MIKNYTSKVPASRSVAHIEDKLVSAGAQNILKIYEDQKLVGIAFIKRVDGKDIPFKLPARVQNAEKLLRERYRRPTAETLRNIAKQAERTAWRLLSDWVDIQFSLIELEQAQFLEIFLPYVYDHTKQETYFEKLKKDDFKMLPYHASAGPNG